MCEREEYLREEDAQIARAERKKKRLEKALKKHGAKCPLLCGSVLYQSETNLYIFYCRKCLRYFLLQPRQHTKEQAFKWMYNKLMRIKHAIHR